MKRIYLAGPDVFFPDASTHFERLRARCAELGLDGIPPSDGGLSSGSSGSGDEIAERIFRANLELIRGCDGLVANLMPFRNPLEPDSGTVFELGFAVALGKPVAAFLPGCERTYEERTIEQYGCERDASGMAWDARYGFLVESFGQKANLMLSRSTPIFPSFEMALRDLRGHFLGSTSVR